MVKPKKKADSTTPAKDVQPKKKKPQVSDDIFQKIIRECTGKDDAAMTPRQKKKVQELIEEAVENELAIPSTAEAVVLAHGKGAIDIAFDSKKNVIKLFVNDEVASHLLDPLYKQLWNRDQDIRFHLEALQLKFAEKEMEADPNQTSLFDPKKNDVYAFHQNAVLALNYYGEDVTLSFKKGEKAIFNTAQKAWYFQSTNHVIPKSMADSQHLEIEQHLAPVEEEKEEQKELPDEK